MNSCTAPRWRISTILQSQNYSAAAWARGQTFLRTDYPGPSRDGAPKVGEAILDLVRQEAAALEQEAQQVTLTSDLVNAGVIALALAIALFLGFSPSDRSAVPCAAQWP